jgi:UDP-N-acetylmuramate dehydrogenase
MNDKEIKQITDDLVPHAWIKPKALMSEFTTFKTGGVADCLVYPRTAEGLSSIVRYAGTNGIPLTVIGGGSNLVISDKGLPGIVIRMAEDDVHKGVITEKESGGFYVDAIVRKRDLISHAVSHGYSGTAFMAGIPGCIGGGICMNAGTFMGNFIDILERIVYCDRTGDLHELSLTRSMGHYRGIDIDAGAVIWGGYFRFTERKPVEQLQREIDEIIADRKIKHPQDPSAGSVFKNPENNQSWKLVNDAGLKGKRIGGAMVSDLHTNFIINAGGATSSDVRDLILFVQNAVNEKFGIMLHPEVRFVGEF